MLIARWNKLVSHLKRFTADFLVVRHMAEHFKWPTVIAKVKRLPIPAIMAIIWSELWSGAVCLMAPGPGIYLFVVNNALIVKYLDKIIEKNCMITSFYTLLVTDPWSGTHVVNRHLIISLVFIVLLLKILTFPRFNDFF